jgi:hypothetical protein
MAKWMNKMGLAAINFNIDDSKIGGFNKGFVDSREGSPASTPIIGGHSSSTSKHQRIAQISSAGDSENDSDKESLASWHRSASHFSSISDIESLKDKVDFPLKKFIFQKKEEFFFFYRVFWIMINGLIYHLLHVMHVHHHQPHYYHYRKPMRVQFQIVLLVK